MHKSYIVSGFLYHLSTQQVLLNQMKNGENGEKSLWTIPMGHGKSKNPTLVFKDLVKKTYKIDLSEDSIFSVYNYIDKESGSEHFVCYGIISDIDKIPESQNMTLLWTNFKKVYKLNFLPQIKHDITIAQRVINASPK